MTPTDKPSFLEFVSCLEPCLGNDYKKEIVAIKEILTAFKCDSPSTLKKPLLSFLRKYNASPEGFSSRIQECLDKRNANEDVSALVTVLVADFAKLTITTIKEIGKKYKINLTKKEDVSYFENWLRMGQDPPTQEELLQETIRSTVMEAIQIRDSDGGLTEVKVGQIVDLAKSVNTKYKVNGLKVFMSGINIAPIGRTGSALIKEITNYLNTLALNCDKAVRMYDL